MVESSFDDKTECLTISIDGRFDYSCHKLFKEAFVSVNKAVAYEIDLSRVTYLDSSALGMLLLLRDHAGGEKANVHLKKPNGAVLDILKIANFHRLFEIEE
ncbi:STAS domain-containing protein [Marinomonas posidonica]|uniref:Sulfate transporter/antisigma-factor antagonist STAS n=1 Tax=Marinomonas posidonica (strain CECT 7376 / NCIMB 14433 / IVIA-Po-181) TaxID=491952 RepID=F6CS79_MARPP|nr:STAS domain-containing protein [Marinomonas posidonica]AEF53866.1 Sulfate transporter/antisigma-factor antagonist STAS [Marinomonas posidonica IVIA-Po-181]